MAVLKFVLACFPMLTSVTLIKIKVIIQRVVFLSVGTVLESYVHQNCCPAVSPSSNVSSLGPAVRFTVRWCLSQYLQCFMVSLSGP